MQCAVILLNTKQTRNVESTLPIKRTRHQPHIERVFYSSTRILLNASEMTSTYKLENSRCASLNDAGAKLYYYWSGHPQTLTHAHKKKRTNSIIFWMRFIDIIKFAMHILCSRNTQYAFSKIYVYEALTEQRTNQCINIMKIHICYVHSSYVQY